MTRQAKLKKQIRARMSKSGERYTAARAVVLAKAKRATQTPAQVLRPGLLPSYTQFGGLQDDTAVLVNMLAAAGHDFPGTGAPYTEAMVHGLCGGVGFLYAVFEYKNTPPMLTIVPRSRSMPQSFVEPLFARIGVQREQSCTSSARVAQKALDAAMAKGHAALCLVDSAMLNHTSTPRAMAGMSPRHVAVIGVEPDSGDLWIDDRSLTPLRVGAADFARARGTYRAGKRALTTLGSLDPEHDWALAWREALLDTAETLREGDPTVPKSFRKNCGLSGMRKFKNLLENPKDKKGWARVFGEGARALAGLRRAYDGIQHDYTAPAAGRPLYAEFLRAAANHLELPGLQEAARSFESAGRAWTSLAQHIANAEDVAVRRDCEIADARAQALDEGDVDRAQALVEERMTLASRCRLDARQCQTLYARMAVELGRVIACEQAAADAMLAAMR